MQTRLLASSLPKSEIGVAGGFVQGHLDFTAQLWISSDFMRFSLLDRSCSEFFPAHPSPFSFMVSMW